MVLKNVWEVCDFSDDIKFGRFDMKRFAVELHSVLDGSADPIYIEPKLFLDNTYPTENMKYVLREALRRLSGKGGEPVLVLDTEFGGGKTHTLLLLYHVFKNRDLGSEYIREIGLHKETGILEVPEARVVAIDCRRISRKTLWGELASELGRYQEFEEEDRLVKPVTNIDKIKLLLREPTLILLDELPDYLLKASAIEVGKVTLSELTLSFIYSLVSAVASTRNCMLVISLTGKQTLFERYVKDVKTAIKGHLVEDLDSKLREVMSRQAKFVVPLEKREIAQVIKRRLIKGIKDDKEFHRVVNAFYDYFEEKGLITSVDYQERMREAYPFHPFLIDVLYDRVSTIPEFNKTRGILRLLAMVLHRIYRDRVDCKLLSTGDIPLEDHEIREELTSRLGRADYNPVIQTDCIEKAGRMDGRRRVKICKKIARTIYLYSLIGATRVSGIRPSELKLAIGYPGLDPSLVDEALREIEREFWYIKTENGSYYFDTEPNINKIIEDYRKEIDDEEARAEIKKTLESCLKSGRQIEYYIWDKDQIPDDGDHLKIFVVDYKEVREGDEKRLAEEILDRMPDGKFRTYKNALIILMPDPKGVENLIEIAKLVCAIKKASKDERVKLSRSMLKAVNERLAAAQGELTATCMNVYSRIAYPRVGDGEISIDELGFGGGGNMVDTILNHLKDKGKLVEPLSFTAIEELIRDNPEKRLKVQQVYEIFRRDRMKPYIPSYSTILDAIRAGVKQGSFGYAETLETRDGKYLAKMNVNLGYVSPDGWLIAPDIVYVGEEKRAEDLQVTKVTTEGLETYLEEAQHRYEITCENLRQLIESLSRLRIILMDKDTRIDFNAHLKKSNKPSDEYLKLEGAIVKSLGELEEVFRLLQDKEFEGAGTIRISSTESLEDDLNVIGVKGWKRV